MDWFDQMDLGVVHPLLWSDPAAFETTIKTIIADSDFGAVEIAPIDDPMLLRKTRDLLAASALQVVYLPTHTIFNEGLELGSLDDDRREAAFTRLTNVIDEAIALNATLAVIASPRMPKPADRDEIMDRLVDDIIELCDYAALHSKKRLLFIALENFDTEIDRKRLIGSTADAVELADTIDMENFGLTLDLSHLPLLGETGRDALYAAQQYIIHARIGNAVVDHYESARFGDSNPYFGHPEGRIDQLEVVDFLQTLDEIDFFGLTRDVLGTTPILSLAVRPAPDEDALTVLSNGKRTFKRAWAAVHSKD